MSQQGYQYEENAAKKLASLKCSTGATAGASHDRPDLELKLATPKSKIVGCELKITATAAGSLVMKYTDGKWYLGDTKDDPEKLLLQDVAKKYKILEMVKKMWGKKVPYMQNYANGQKYVTINDRVKAYELDMEQFGGRNEPRIPIDAIKICDYYTAKKCDYINVGTHGFYLLNTKDGLGLNKKIQSLGGVAIPHFSKSTKAEVRVRCQYKKVGDYQFVMTMEFKGVIKSPYNIAPVISKDNVTIDVKKLNIKENKLLLAAFRK